MARSFLSKPGCRSQYSACCDYDRNKFLRDLVAGVTVGLVALPLAMAFAIASGSLLRRVFTVPSITGFLISLLGDQRRRLAARLAPSWW
jgi:MFS superfamily sulfate permease-like transporter